MNQVFENRRRTGARLFLVILPLLLAMTWAAFLHQKGPYWLGSNLDPDYVYLFNALNVLRSLPPGHTDHPGTFVQLLGAGVIRVTYAVTGRGAIVTDVLSRPEFYLHNFQYALFALYAGVLMALGLITLTVSGSLASAAVAQLTPLLSSTILAHIACVKPEIVLLTVSAVAGLLTSTVVRWPRMAADPVLGMAFGLVLGAALAAKITAAPLVLLPLLLLSGRARVALLISTAVFVALFTIPAWSVLVRFLWFAYQLATHAGIHGGGLPSLIEPENYAKSAVNLAVGQPIMLASVVVAMAACLFDGQMGGGRSQLRRAIWAVVAAQLGCVALVARHAKPHYLMPALGLTGTSLALTWSLLRPWLAKVPWATAGVGSAVLVAVVVSQGPELEAAVRTASAQRIAQLEMSESARKLYPNARVIFYYRASNPAYALHFGDAYVGKRYASEIAALQPGALYYDFGARKLEVTEPLTPKAGLDGQVDFLMQGVPLSPERQEQLPFPVRLVPIRRIDYEVLYEVR